MRVVTRVALVISVSVGLLVVNPALAGHPKCTKLKATYNVARTNYVKNDDPIVKNSKRMKAQTRAQKVAMLNRMSNVFSKHNQYYQCEASVEKRPVYKKAYARMISNNNARIKQISMASKIIK